MTKLYYMPGADEFGLPIYSSDNPIMTYCISIHISQQSAVLENVYAEIIFLLASKDNCTLLMCLYERAYKYVGKYVICFII